MKRLYGFVFAFILTLAGAGAVRACSFIGYPDPPLRYRIVNTKTIYLGEVVKNTASNQTIRGEKYSVQTIVLKVVKAYKGIEKPTDEINLYEVVNKTSCDYEQPKPGIGERWVVYVDDDEKPFLGRPYSPTVNKYDPKKSAEFLSKVEAIIRNPVTAIYGQIDKYLNDGPMANLKIVAVSNGTTLKTTTDKEGRFSFENIAPGTYKIRVYTPFQAADNWEDQDGTTTKFDIRGETHFFEYSVSLTTGDAAYRYFHVQLYTK